jgi:hypothetical protein
VQPIAQFGAVEAYPFSNHPTLFIESPSNYPEDIYQTTSIPIEVKAEPYETGIKFVDIYYSLDDGPNIKLTIVRYEANGTINTAYFGKGTLDNLTNGYHTVKAYSTDTQGNTLSHSRTFLVNTTLRFPTLLLSPNNITYYSKEVPLTYTIDDSKYIVDYQLDNSGGNRLTGNTTLSGLSEGRHTIIAHASDIKTGIYTKQTSNFTVDTTNPFPVPTETVPEFPSALIAAFLVAAVLSVSVIFRRKTKHE